MKVITNNDSKCATALAALKLVDDPEIGLNIVDLGLVYNIEFLEDINRVICTMTLTSQFCPMGETIVDNVTQALQEAFSGATIDVNLIFEPSWGQHLISEEGLEFLGR
ncbi:MAG: hypothetical protein RJA25_659 [Bacteroidota bacterium]|jgi:metal-sulfur cluster biosynthetic enzyme